MSYFRELPNISAVSLLPGRTRSDERVTVKNIFKRAKLRTDVDTAITAYDFRVIKENERPDTIANSVYGDPELDYIILITNNIIDVRSEWPLSNRDLYNYMLDKYGSDAALQEVHHYETIEVRDDNNRTVLEGGLIVDEDFTFEYTSLDGRLIQVTNPTGPVTNFTYETLQNDAKRVIRILKVEFVGAFISDMRKMMKYETSSQYINRTTKAAYNPREFGV
tara:strand:- start:128 stop:790 length:663 start_codon:yes stop_codon:yes gene_type:complete